MKVTIRDSELLKSLSSLDINAYIQAQGWLPGDKIQDKALVFTKDDSELILPLRKDLNDFALRISELLSTLSDIENRSELSIIEDINKSGVDIIRIKLMEGVVDGSLPLSITADIFTYAREMLLTAASAAHQPKKSYSSRRPEEATDYLNTVRVGQTEHGSYILTFLSPVAPELHQTTLFEDGDPFARLATKTLVKGLHSTKNAAIKALSDGEMIHFENAISSGVSANLCEAIANIVNKAGPAEISLTWAKTRPLLNQTLKNTISFDREIVNVIGEAARNFRLSEPKTDQIFTGWVFQLKQQDKNDKDGTIRLTVEVDNKPKNLKVILSEVDYKTALEAHTNKNLISIEGDLYRQGKETELRNPRNLMMINQDE